MFTKKIFFIFTFIFIGFGLKAQTNVLFEDNFNSNTNNWLIANNANVQTQIYSGKYVMTHKNEGTSWRFWHSIYLDPSKDFYIEGKVKQSKGATNYGYGLVWGASGWGNSYSFIISSNGQYRIYGYKDKKIFVIKDWTISSDIKKMGNYNVLGVQRKEDKMNFFLNGKQIHTCDNKGFYGSYSGFMASDTMTIEADYFIVKHPEIKINLLETPISEYSKKNMGRGINSIYSEIAPIISPDGNTLYVPRKNHPDNNQYGMYDVWYTEKQANGTWGEPKRMPAPINNEGDNLIVSVSPDNNSLIVEGLYAADGSYISDNGISISYRTASGWSIPKKIEIKNFYNHNQYESYCPSGDRNIIIMSVQRDDSYGQKDLYVSFKNADGTYTEPKNMGTDLNTYENEGTPFLASDNRTLYFYTYGKPGYGSADIFVTKRLDDTWTKWSEPKNMGHKINTKDWDTYFSISAKGDYAYLVSTDASLGNEDIFEIKLQEEARPDPVVLISGFVYNKKTNAPIEANIVYEDLTTGKVLGRASSSPTTGEYKIVIPYGKSYSFRATSKKFVSISENIDITEKKEYQEINKNLYLAPVEEEQVINLNNIFFERGKAVILKQSYFELSRLYDILVENPTMEIQINAHTDNKGNAAKNLKLSEERAQEVKKYLTDRGIDANRLKTKGFGGTIPIASNATEVTRRLNRRVEFIILKK